MELYYAFSGLIVLSTIFAYFNFKVLKLPTTIGIMLISMFLSIVLIVVGKLFQPQIITDAIDFFNQIDLENILMGAMLNFLLFAGAIHIKMKDLKAEKNFIMIFSSLSVLISTAVIGGLLYLCLGQNVPFIQCLLFGALISPTDPVAVLAILKQAKIPKSLEVRIAGESLFNDGVAVVVFLTIFELAKESVDFTTTDIIVLFAKEALGGLGIGLLLGYLASLFMKKIDDYKIEVLITLTVVMGGHLLCQALHFSGPLAMVVAGLVIGNYGKSVAMSDVTKDYVDKFWELIDEILNIVLFMLIGFEILLIPNIQQYWVIGLVSIIIVLIARSVSIWIPSFINFKTKIDKHAYLIMIWGGLRGGVSIALALSLQDNMNKELFLAITYCVVVFSILVQGLTIKRVATKKQPKIVLATNVKSEKITEKVE